MPELTNGQHTYTLAEGVPYRRNDTDERLLTGSGGGHVLLTSTQLIETLAHFSRERIPERTVHAKAAGARGYFEVTDDISDLTDADFLTGIGKKTEVLVRISTVGPEKGSADTVRDFRGFAIKFKTAQGNNDWVFNNQVRQLLIIECHSLIILVILSRYFLSVTQSNFLLLIEATRSILVPILLVQTCSGTFISLTKRVSML